MEEVEAAKLQSRQLQMMEEEDFLDTFVPKTSEKKAESQKVSVDAVTKDFSKLSSKEQSNLFRQQNPEFDGVVADFNSRMKEAMKLSKVVSLADAGEIPEGPCLDFVKYKLELLMNYCTNISAYLMFKSKGVSLTLHPVTTRLVQYRLELQRRSLKVFEKRSLKSLLWVGNLYQSSTILGLDLVSSSPPQTN